MRRAVSCILPRLQRVWSMQANPHPAVRMRTLTRVPGRNLPAPAQTQPGIRPGRYEARTGCCRMGKSELHCKEDMRWDSLRHR